MSKEYPQHVAIVMDGNGRWAKKRFLPRAAGHRAGAKAVRKAVEFCIHHEINVLTLFALSVENRLSRPAREVSFLLSLFGESLQRNIGELHQNNVRIRIIGDRQCFEPSLQHLVESAEQQTISNTGLTLVIAINYSGRWDLTQAMQQLAKAVAQQQLPAEALDQAMLNDKLSLADLPEPDLLIRTSGEQRISNFMLWQLAYTELFFTPTYWPDFDATAFQQAIDFYRARERRFGAITEEMEA